MRKNIPPYIPALLGTIFIASRFIIQNIFSDLLAIFGAVLLVVGIISMLSKKGGPINKQVIKTDWGFIKFVLTIIFLLFLFGMSTSINTLFFIGATIAIITIRFLKRSKKIKIFATIFVLLSLIAYILVPKGPISKLPAKLVEDGRFIEHCYCSGLIFHDFIWERCIGKEFSCHDIFYSHEDWSAMRKR